MVYLGQKEIFVKVRNKWGKVFKNGPSKICERQPLKSLLSPFLNNLPQMFDYWTITKTKLQDVFFIRCQTKK